MEKPGADDGVRYIKYGVKHLGSACCVIRAAYPGEYRQYFKDVRRNGGLAPFNPAAWFFDG